MTIAHWLPFFEGAISGLPERAGMTLTLLIGVLELLGVPGALFYIAPAVIASFVIAGSNAWVLLVEIIR
jgi:hypothetical protein